MGSHAERAAEAKEEHLGALRLQEKFNCVRQYHGLVAKQEDFCKEWNRGSGKVLQVTLTVDKLAKWGSFPACATRRLYT